MYIKNILLSLCVASFMSLLEVRCEVYTSTQDLTNMFSLERRMVTALSQYLTKTEVRLTRIRKYLREYEQVVADWGTDSETLLKMNNGSILTAGEWPPPESILGLQKLAENPIHAFHLMKRMTVDWKHIGEHPPSEDWKGVEEALGGGLNEADDLINLPKDEDLHGAAQALVRLQDVYHLNMSNLARGNVWGIQTAAELTAQDCLYMGKHSFNLGLYSRAVEWFEEAYTLAGLEHNSTVTQNQVVTFLATATKAHNESQKNERNLDHQTENSDINDETLKKDSVSPKKKHRVGNDLSVQEDADNFQALCRGEQLLSSIYISNLHCFYDDRKQNYYKLMPVKVEQIHHDPGLVVFHDVISDREIIHLQALSKPLLTRAMVQGMKGKGNTVSNTRTSKIAWLHETVDPLIGTLAHRISILTGLSTNLEKEHAEMLQVANYGIGGHYNPHHDYLLADKSNEDLTNNIHPRELILGDRIATFMFYLSDVSRGGATAFPRLGTALWPSRGSAAFWYNLKKSGTANSITLHGACPVVVGSKWVSNQWIRSNGQFLARPCGMSPEI